MRTKIINLILACFMISCAQKKEESKIMQNPHITADNFVKEVMKKMKHFPQEKVYSLGYGSSYCFFEVFINDFPVFKEFKTGAGNSGFEINPYISKSGKQKVTYKMYPANKSEFGNYTILRDNSFIELDLVSYDMKNQGKDDVEYSKHKSPMKTNGDAYTPPKSALGGKDYYEGSFEIEVDVPFIHPMPYENARDLTKMDKKELEAKVLQFYEKLKLIYNNKEVDNIARINFDATSNELCSLYLTEKEIEKKWKEIIESVNSNDFKIQRIENYKLQFYGNGKLVSLISKSTEAHLRQNSALWAKYTDEDGDLSGLKIIIYLYIPEGETEFKVY
ncbi:hypothetical protein [Flavobacterium columnare]|uniref:Lipoprotein n=1 Tax=Flavobacterium columnare TaxID=996 RepID=A0AAI8GBL7_9FLAO|nr:hypothetical protein [Flavobacterium columnare]AMO20629.2 hypothetical protein UN65_10040 [Flavobacterium columnare]QOG57688.1 hypothetical protein HUE29_10120 [Flavobacterium columnare]QOG60412.1 hypothetical protein HUE30_10120 [Flavobacterium columnare]QOG63132.1 hypothetical protein HUE31_10120 [Flavobacterium columnare]QOG65855.1 hypothetical protein HUE32_10130 [Flavobacterium columnare]